MTDYITSAQFKVYAGIPASTTTHDTISQVSVTGASRAIDRWCSRSFVANSTTTSSRVYRATQYWTLDVDDIATSSNLTIATDSANDGTFETTWASTDYELLPLNGLLGGLTWPYTEIRAVANNTFPVSYYATDRAHVQVTAAFGWPSVPDDIVQATYILALDLFKMKDAPFGVAGNTDYGVMRVRENNELRMLLDPFRRMSPTSAIVG